MSTASLTAITLNLTFWMIPLLLVSVARITLPFAYIRHCCNMGIEAIYRSAAAFDSWWIKHVLGIHLDIQGELPRRDRNLIIICNHRSWFDILVLHSAIIRHSPIIRFLIKHQLVYVPILGWICLALDFPRLYRAPDPEHRARDHRAIADATSSLNDYPTALLSFAEGTRYTPEKHKAQQSPWPHLLKPKPGGLRIMLEHAEDSAILDITLVYPQEDITFWMCLAGTLPYVKVYLDYFEPGDIEDAAEWLAQRWWVKESLITGA